MTSIPSVGRIVIRQMESTSIWNIGFWIHPEHWNNGYATEAGYAVLEFGFAVLGASKITTAHATWNVPSKKVIEKLGFKYIRENPCGFIKAGNRISEYEYEINANVF